MRNIVHLTNVFFFVSALKTVSLEVIAIFSLPEPINFSASEGQVVESPHARNCPEKIKNRKWQANFFVFNFSKNFKLVPISLELNSALGNRTYFYQKCGSCTQKSNETWDLKIRVKIWKKKKKKKWWSKGSRWKVVGPKSLYIQDLKIYGSSIGQIRFSFWSFNFWLSSDFYQKTLKKWKK